jgi:aquaporin Z
MKQLAYYFLAEILGAILGSILVKYVIGTDANLGANSPNYVFPLPTIFGIEVLASALLMAVIVIVVYKKGLRGYSGLVIGGIVGLDIFFLAFISGASMKPARSLGPTLVSGTFNDLWLYWSATFVGTCIVALLVRNKFAPRLRQGVKHNRD